MLICECGSKNVELAHISKGNMTASCKDCGLVVSGTDPKDVSKKLKGKKKSK